MLIRLKMAIVIIVLAVAFECTSSETVPEKDLMKNQGTAAGGPRIVNFVNFIRGVEPRTEVDLLEPVVQQIRLAKDHCLPATFLIQYDALLQERFVRLLKAELDDRYEIGGWLEIVQPQCEKAGIPWRGRYPWDWHVNVGFSVGYTPEEREKLVDVFMQQFRDTFGYLPKSVGSWFIDAHTLSYMAEKYGVIASCNCKDQMGTDGYTLWGGYWNQAYYPSRINAFMPAQNAENQIPIPVFRMLGSDPIYQYDLGLGTASQGVISLEPVYCAGGGGGWPEWVRWFFEVQTEMPCLGFAYAQMGQENSFGWPAMSKGLTDQVEVVEELVKKGKVRVETLADSAEWFKEEFPVTPATTVVVTKDWKNEGRQTVWYNSRFYRCNLLWKGDSFRIRDIHLFDESLAEPYLTRVEETSSCVYHTLPVLDGFNWSTPEDLAGIRLFVCDEHGQFFEAKGLEPIVTAADVGSLHVEWPLTVGGSLVIEMEEDSLRFCREGDKWKLQMRWATGEEGDVMGAFPESIKYGRNGRSYSLNIRKGLCRQGVTANLIDFTPSGGNVVLEMAATDNH